MEQVTIARGFSDEDRPWAGALYWSAFGGKLGRVLGPKAKAEAFLARTLDPNFSLAARGPDGRLLGLAGFKLQDGAFVGGTFRDLWAIYRLGAFWRLILLMLLDRPAERKTLVMDGICVAAEARGMGIGGALLDAIIVTARDDGLAEVRLDVIDTNPRARALYDRKGFEPVRVHRTGLFKPVFGFAEATEMRYRLATPQRSD